MVRATVVIGALSGALALGAVEGNAQVSELNERLTGGQAGAGWIGISFRSSPPPAEDVVVEDVVDNAPAERVGVLVGDRIVLWNGEFKVVRYEIVSNGGEVFQCFLVLIEYW